MKRKHLLFPLILGSSSALLIVVAILLRPSTPSLGHPLTETTLPVTAVAIPSPLLHSNTDQPPESSFPPPTHTRSFDSLVLTTSTETQNAVAMAHVEDHAPAAADRALPAGLDPQSLPPGLTLDLTYGAVMGWLTPGDTITVTTTNGQGAAVADGVGFFWTALWHADGYPVGFGSSATIFVNGANVANLTLPTITGGLDVLADKVSGVIAGNGGGTVVTITLGVWNQPPVSGAPWAVTHTASDGSFNVTFGDVDLGAETLASVDVVVNGVTVRTYLYPDPSVFLAQQYNAIAGYAPSGQMGQVVAATVYSVYPGEVRWQGETKAGWPHSYYAFENVAMDIGDVIEVDVGGGVVLSTTVVKLSDLSFDVALNQVQGTAPTGAIVRASMWQRQADHWVYTQTLTTAIAGNQFAATSAADMRPRDDVYVVVADANGNQIQLFSGPPYVAALQDPYSNTDCVMGRLDGPGLPFTVSLTVDGTIYERHQDWFTSDAGNRAPFCYLIRAADRSWGPIDFTPGNTATLESPTWRGNVVVANISMSGDTAAHTVSGDAPSGDVDVTVSQWNYTLYPLYGAATRATTTARPFTVDFSSFDIRDGSAIMVDHFDPITGFGNQFNGWQNASLPFLEVRMPDCVGGVTANANEKATAELYDVDHHLLASTSNDQDEGPWHYWLCDFGGYALEAGDWVTVTTESGWTAGLKIPQLEITGDLDSNLVTGQGPLDLLYVEGGRWDSSFGVFVPGSEFTVDTLFLNHDLDWGDYIAVSYEAPDGNRVRCEVQFPAPELGIWKGNTSGSARPGGVINYRMEYKNDGTRVATDTLIVDTLPPFTTYASDNSGFTPEIGAGGVVTWHVGDLAPGTGDYFVVTLNVDENISEGSGTLAENCVDISASTPGDSYPDNNHACSGAVDVWNDEVEMSVNKWPKPEDPTPGQEFVYEIQVCNNRSAAAGPVLLTDIVPVNATAVSWYNDNIWEISWQNVTAPAGIFALTTAGFPGNTCDTIHLRARLDAGTPLGINLSNRVTVTVEDDVNLDNNEYLDTKAYTKPPRYEFSADKWFSGGALVPGGWIRYGVNHWNGGNMPVHDVWLTDTLPAGTVYQSGSAQRHSGQYFPPDEMTAETIAWNMGDLAVADGFGFDFVVNIDNDILPGTVLTNCVTIDGAEPDEYPDNNLSCVTQQVFDHGPNLRVTKDHWWWGGNGQLGYRIQFYNVGDETVSNVWITDTLPAGTTWDGNWNLKFDWKRLVEQSLTSDVLAWRFSELYPGDSGAIEFTANLDEPGTPLRWYTNTVEITPLANDANPADNVYEDVAFSGGEVQWVNIDVSRTHIWGCAPQAPITITTALAQMTTGNSCWDEYEFPDLFDPGDVVTITAGAGLHPAVIAIPAPFTGHTSSITDTVWGQIGALDHQQVQVNLWNVASQWTETDEQGHYSVTYPDIPRGAQGDVQYWTEIDYASVGFHHRLVNPDLVITVDYSSESVDANYERGHTGWITVTNSAGTEIKATIVVTTEAWSWWKGNSGFSTHHHQWYPERPDIQPNDWVYASMDNGYSTAVQVGTINAELDVDNDTLSGTLDVPWFTDGLRVRCEIHENNAPGIEFEKIDPNGGAFFCDFGGAWDITPGQTVAVRYTEPDGDQVMFRPPNPAPHLHIEKWLDSGDLGEGGNAVFRVEYRNQGDADAENVVITDTFQGMTYLADTSGFPHTGGGGQVVWQLGTVAAGDWINFYVFAQVTAGAGERVTNTVQIATSNPYDQGDPSEKWHEWSGEVRLNDTRLNIGTWPWTNDPAAGYDVVFHVNLCNNGGTASSDVTITDTLHPSMTLQTWWAGNPGWVEAHRSAQQLVLTRPTLLGWRCEVVYVRATVDADAWQGMALWNQAVIYGANDLSAGDDEGWWWGNVNNPHSNLYINKTWNGGQLVPGGVVHYNIYIHNDGNVPVGAFTLTDTLPVSTTFVAAWKYDTTGQQVMNPTSTSNGVLVWELPGMDNGYWCNIDVTLWVSYNALPGTVLVNIAQVTRLPGEDRDFDNTSTVTEILNGHGPNLRVSKWGDWHGDRQGHVWYGFRVENVGDASVTRAVITDTYPLLMALEGDINTDWSRVVNYRENPAEHWIEFTLENLDLDYRLDFSFNATMDEPVTEGLILTNTVTVAPVVADTNPADDTFDYILTTGPDLYVEKTLVGGAVRPGELITFSLRFGNGQPGHTWWWNMEDNAILTDTLPAGFEYVNAVRHWCGETNWCEHDPDRWVGGSAVWDLWPLQVGQWDELYITARVPVNVDGLDSFTNHAEIAAIDPLRDTEAIFTNNHAALDLPVNLPYFKVGKAYKSTRVAGTPITYTLTVTNIGHGVGTGVILSDTIPAGLENVGGGTIILPWMWWHIDRIAANGGVATEKFAGTLPCVGTVVNNDYRVVDSDQGVSSAVGAPVSLVVIAPTVDVSFSRTPGGSVAAGAPVTFTATATTNGAPLRITWDFGDGTTMNNAPSATHVYTQEGAYLVMVTAVDACGYNDTALGVIQVRAPILTAAFAQSTSSVMVSRTVAFTDTSTTDGAPIVAWQWNFGDASAPAFTANVSHTYTRVGVFAATLTITDALGYHKTATGSVTVRAPTLVAAFTSNTTLALVGETVIFTNASTTDGPTIIAWNWNFGDNSPHAFTENASHAFTDEGTFTVTLIVTDALSFSDGYQSAIHIASDMKYLFLPLVMRTY